MGARSLWLILGMGCASQELSALQTHAQADWGLVDALDLRDPDVLALGLAGSGAPVQLWLWGDLLSGCAPEPCPTAVITPEGTTLVGDCVDGADRDWVGSAWFGSAEDLDEGGSIERSFSGFGYSGPDGGLEVDGTQRMSLEDDALLLETPSLHLRLWEERDGRAPLDWPGQDDQLHFWNHRARLSPEGGWEMEGGLGIGAGPANHASGWMWGEGAGQMVLDGDDAGAVWGSLRLEGLDAWSGDLVRAGEGQPVCVDDGLAQACLGE